MARNITLPTVVDLSTASTDLYFRTGGSTITYLPTGGWNGGDACEFTPPNMYPPPVQNANQGYSALGNFILVQRPQVLFTRWMFRGSPDYFSQESRWAARAGQKSFVLRRSNGGDGIERVMVVFNGYGPGQFTIAICNGVDCRFPIPRFPLHEHVQGKWVCFEVEANLQTGMKRLYITTEDGRLRNFVLQEEALAPGPPTDTWSDIDFIGFFAGPIDTSIPGFSFKMSDVAISNQFIGAPVGFGEGRMPFTVTVNGQCAGGGHINLVLNARQQTRQVTVNQDDLLTNFSNVDDVRDFLIPLLRQRIKESGATTPAQRRAAIESAPFYI